MAECGEWNRKGATLSDVTAKAEYGVDRDFIVNGIRAGKLEYREGAIWGNPYLRLLRSQLEKYIAEMLGEDYLARLKGKEELRKIKKEISDLKDRLKTLEIRKIELEKQVPEPKGRLPAPSAKSKINPALRPRKKTWPFKVISNVE
jgi:hypothetical protein